MNYSNYRYSDIQKKINDNELCYPIDVIITGVTGAGKSTTLNTIFQKEIAKVGNGVCPETMKLDSYKLSDWLRLWDTPGLGDGVDKDTIHKQNITRLLNTNVFVDFELYGYIDLVIVVIEGSKKDLGSTRTLLNEVILPNIDSKRVLVVINQADVAMKGRNWNQKKNLPNSELLNYLDDFATSLQRRIYEDTGLSIPKPIYYSAEKQYNIEGFLDFIIDNTPINRRSANKVKTRSGDASNVCIEEPTYYFEEGNDWIGFSFEKIVNSSSLRNTGELKIVCWLSNSEYSFENGFENTEHYFLDQKWLGHLNRGETMNGRKNVFDIPHNSFSIQGLYYIVFTINELSDDGNWYIIDYVNCGIHYMQIQ